MRRVAVVGVVAVTAVLLPGVALATVSPSPSAAWGTNGRITVILPVAGRVFVGGKFTAVVDRSGTSYPANNLAVFDGTTGNADPTWPGSTNGSVTGLATDGSRLFVGGTFSTVDGQASKNLGAVDLADGSLAWTSSVSSTVDALATIGSSLYVAGNFTKITDGTGTHAQNYVARLNASSGSFTTGWAPGPDARVRALVPSTDGTQVYLGGDFFKVGGVSGTTRVAAVSATTGAVNTTFQPTANNGTSFATVYDLTTDGTNVYEAVGGAGGACTAVDASTGARVWSKHSNGNLHGVRLISGVAYCGGHFSGTGAFDGQTRNKLAAVDVSTGTTLSFAPTINSSLGVWCLGTDGTRLYAGGDFTKINKISASHYAMFVDSSQQTVPGAPTLGATADATTIHLSWQPGSDGGTQILNYTVYRAVGTGTLKKLTTTTGTSYDDSAVTPGTSYSYVVTATNAVGEGAQSNQVTAQLNVQTAPGAPTGLAASDVGGTTAHLVWTAPASDGGSTITMYSIYRGTASGQESLIGTTADGTTTSYDDATVTPTTLYYYYVTATNIDGESQPSNEVSISVGATIPGSPSLTGTAASGVNQLSWTPPTNDGGSPITKYVVTRADVGRLATVSASTTTFNDTAITAGTSYTYQVRAVNAIGAGPYSNKVILTAQP